MNIALLKIRASVIAFAASLLFLIDLSLGWQRASVEIGGVVDVDATSSGWNGPGLVAGMLAIVLIVLALGEIGGRSAAARHVLAAALVPVALIATTAFAVFGGDASVDTSAVGIEVDRTLWPAWVGLGLSIVAGIAGLVPVAAELSELERPRIAPGSPA